MIDFPYIKDIARETPGKIVMLVVDGLGGLPLPETGRSELETAALPNLDALARSSAAGLTTPVATGITPGSGPGHTALFGYDPVKYLVGRGVLEALGLGVELADGDVAIRCNFCTVDDAGMIIDRRAGRISGEEAESLVDLLRQIEVPGVSLSLHASRGHRFVLVLSGEGLGTDVAETDPGTTGLAAIPAVALSDGSQKTAEAVGAFITTARDLLSGQPAANMVLARGYSQVPDWPSMADAYRLSPAAIAAYPMYRGLASVLGMEILSTGETFDDELDTLESAFDRHDFFFIHYKPADAAGEDGDFQAKVLALEELDSRIPRLLALGADALVVAGDHSTPAIAAAHTWHPVPLLVHSVLTAGDGVSEFTERACALGSIGRVPATGVMMLALANAGKLQRFGP